MTAEEAQLSSAFDSLSRLATENEEKLRAEFSEALALLETELGNLNRKHAEEFDALRKIALALLPLARSRVEDMHEELEDLREGRKIIAEPVADVAERVARADLVVTLAADALGVEL
ncbi:MAG: hypothetical protein ACOZQL_10785 [Myxococcota bacterium]